MSHLATEFCEKQLITFWLILLTNKHIERITFAVGRGKV